ncbi:hypothetical protein BD414DRAFT_476028 [Trametes punicea]|nr:hypothetical protein BD414DRAFT_476028 [Trametes punicea]
MVPGAPIARQDDGHCGQPSNTGHFDPHTPNPDFCSTEASKPDPAPTSTTSQYLSDNPPRTPPEQQTPPIADPTTGGIDPTSADGTPLDSSLTFNASPAPAQSTPGEPPLPVPSTQTSPSVTGALPSAPPDSSGLRSTRHPHHTEQQTTSLDPDPISSASLTLGSSSALLPSSASSSAHAADAANASLTSGQPSASSGSSVIRSGSNHTGAIVGGVLGGAVFLLLALTALALLRRRMRARRTAPSAEFMAIARRGGILSPGAGASTPVPFDIGGGRGGASGGDGAATPTGDWLLPLARQSSLEDDGERPPPFTPGNYTDPVLEKVQAAAEMREMYRRRESYAAFDLNDRVGSEGHGVDEKGPGGYAFAL